MSASETSAPSVAQSGVKLCPAPVTRTRSALRTTAASSSASRGRAIVAPKGDSTRLTADRTREALFSMLVSRIGSFEGLAVADMFAGSGALGLEALSRGAGSCLFVEQDKAALQDELERLRVKRDKDVAALDELIAQLKPLIEEV